MKISSASKKVLASALSAAMVVAFAPTVAFGASTVVATNTYYDNATGAEKTVDYYDADKAFYAALSPELLNTPAAGSAPAVTYDPTKAAVTLAGDVTLKNAIVESSGGVSANTKVTVDLAGHTLTSGDKDSGTLANSAGLILIGEGTLKDGTPVGAASNFDKEGITVGASKVISKVTFSGKANTNFGEITVAEGSSIELGTGQFKIASDGNTLAAFEDAVNVAYAAGATVEVNSGGGFVAYDGTYDLAVNNDVKVSASNVSLNGTTYTDIRSALDAGAGTASAPVTLLADLDENTGSVNSAGHINLNGHTIDRAAFSSSGQVTLYGTGTLTGMDVQNSAANIVIADGANITIDNSAARKNEKAAKKSELQGTITVNGTLTIADTTDTSNAAITVIDGTVNTKAGYFGDFVLSSGYAVIDGGAFDKLSNSAGELTVSKATYVDSAGKELAKKSIADGSVLNIKGAETGNNFTYEVGAPVATAKVTRLAADEKTKFTEDVKCASLQGAVYNASDDTTVTLDADVKGIQKLYTGTLSKGITVDLAGHTVTGGIETYSNKITVKNGTVIGSGAYAVDVKSGSAIIESGTYSAEPKTTDGNKTNPKGLINSAGIIGGTFKNATYAVASNCDVKGGTFDKKVTPATGYSIAQNADGTWTVSLGGVTVDSFGAVNGVIKTTSTVTSATKFEIADKDKALEKAVSEAYSKALTAAQTIDPKATALAGFEFGEKDPVTHELYNVKALTDNGADTNVKFALVVKGITLDKTKLAADKDYSVMAAYKVEAQVIVKAGKTLNGTTYAANEVIGTLTGIAFDASFEYTQADAANYTYGFLGDKAAAYDATKKAYTFSATTGAEFGVERISNSILELQEQMKQMEIAAQDKAAANSIKGTAKTIKTKKGVTAKKYTVKVKAVTSESGAKATFKKANTAGKSKITVAKSGTITIKKGLKKGTYKVKVKGTVGASSKTVYAKIVIK